MKPIFISMEGIEGAGKSTAVSFLQAHLLQHNIIPLMTREPGGTPIAESIRDIVLMKTDEPMDLKAELLLMFATRAQHLQEVIRPALQQGQWVLSDRFIDATYAYQAHGHQLGEAYVSFLEQWIVGTTIPDVTFLLDAPVEVCLSRMRAQKKGCCDRIEEQDRAFFERVRQGYLYQAEKYAARFIMIDADQPLEVVQEQLKQAIAPYLE